MILAILLLLSSFAGATTRAVMEGTATSNNTVFVDTVNARVGISSNSPTVPLDVNGAALFRSTITTNFAAVTPSTPTANSIFKNNLVGAWAVFIGTNTGNSTILGGYNIDYITRTGIGNYTVHFGTPFASQYSYGCTTSVGYSTGENSCETPKSNMEQTAASIQLACIHDDDLGGAGQDMARISIICTGAQ